MADIVHPIPWQISNFLPGTPNSGGYSLSSYAFDYALGGIPFLSATRDAWPYSEGMAEIRKQQFDSSAEPGEQSIYGWWLRSQNSWTSGAGLLYQDPDVVNPYTRSFDLRFDDSLGVDNWTPGQLTLLKQPVSKYNVGGTFAQVRGYVDPSGVDAAFYMDNNVLYKMTDSTRTAITTGSAGTALGLANFGTRWFLVATDGVWTGVDTGAGAKIWNAPAGTLTSGAIEVVKQRLMVGWNNSLYMLTMDGTAPVGPPAPPALPTAWAGGYGLVITHPDVTWQWSSITEGPSAIYASGYNGTDSSIYRFVSDLSSTTETFVPIVTAQLPEGSW